MRRPPTTAVTVLLVTAAAAVQRALFVAATRADVVFAVPALDGAFYHTWARSLAEGRGDFQGPYFLGPFYPHLLALLYRAFGPEPWAVRVFQSALGVLDVALVTWLGCRTFGPLAAAIAGAGVALFAPLAFHEGVLALDVPYVTLTLASLCLVLCNERAPVGRAAVASRPAPSRASFGRAIGAGALLGLATLARPTAALLLPVAIWAARPGQRLHWALACVATWAAVIAPVVARNARLGGGLTITTNGGVNFWAGNNADANGRFHAPPGVHFFTSPLFAATEAGGALPPAVAARALTVRAVAGTDDAARSRRWTRAALTWMVRHPLDALGLWLRKAWLLLQAREIAQIESTDFHARRLGMRVWFPVDFGWLWPLAALGVWGAWRERRRDARIVAAFAAGLLLPCLIFFVTGRYRMAALPEVSLLAGFGAATLVAAARRRDRRRVAGAVAAIVAIAVLAQLGARPPRGAAGWEHAQMAERLYAAGDPEAAIREQEAAARLLPDRPEVQINLALYWHERGASGDLQRAVELLRRTAQSAPQEPAAHYNLGVLLEAVGDTTGAIEAWRRTLRVDPGFDPARSRLLEAGAPPGP